MTSIAATGNSTYLTPLQKLQDELQSEVSSGAVTASDQDPLSSALTDIDSSVQSSGDPTGAKPSADDLKSKINDLIAGEVSSGKLTADQATELQGVFANAFAGGTAGDSAAPGSATGAVGGSSGPHRAGGHHGGHHGAKTTDATSTTDGSTATTASTSDTSADDILQQFLKSVQGSLSSSLPASYSSTGDSTNGNGASSLSALLINYQT
jgi:hypothetical protein